MSEHPAFGKDVHTLNAYYYEVSTGGVDTESLHAY